MHQRIFLFGLLEGESTQGFLRAQNPISKTSLT